MRRAHLIWIIPLKLLKAVAGIVIMLLIAVACLLYVPSVRHTVLHKGVEIANEHTDYDIDLGRIYLSPFHHSPTVFYHAYRGEADLPLRVEIDSLFVGHRGQDTLIYIHSLRLQATYLTAKRSNSETVQQRNGPAAKRSIRRSRSSVYSHCRGHAAIGIRHFPF